MGGTSKKVLEKRWRGFQGWELRAPQWVSPQSSARVAGDKDEATRAGEAPEGNAAHPTDLFLLF